MKKYSKYLLVAIVMMLSVDAMAGRKKEKVELSEKDEKRIVEINSRVEEIKKMDKSNLSSFEKKELKSELKQIKHEANSLSRGGIYISATAVIIIILLLIIL